MANISVASGLPAPGWAALQKEKSAAVNDLEQAQKSGDEKKVTNAQKELDDVKTRMIAYDQGYSEGASAVENFNKNCPPPQGAAQNLDVKV